MKDLNRTWESVFLISVPGDSADQVSPVNMDSVLSWAHLSQGCVYLPFSSAS